MATYTDRVMVLQSNGVPTRIGASDTIELSSGNLTIGGNLTVSGTTTINNTELQTADRYILQNANYTANTAQDGGIVVNVDPAANSFTITAVTASTDTFTVSTDPTSVLAAGDIIIVTGVDPQNIGLFEVSSVTTTTVVIKSAPDASVSGIVSTDLALDESGITGTLVQVKIGVLKTNTASNEFQIGFGDATPISFSALGTAGGSSLQSAYSAGNTITLVDTSGDFIITLDDSGTAANFQITDATGDFLITDATNNTLDLGSASVGVDFLGSVTATGNGTWNFGTGQSDFGGNVDISNGLDVDGGALTMTGSNIDLDPTGLFTLDMDASQTATITLADNLADAFLIQEGANAYLDITTTNASEAMNFGNATTNPTFNFLGTGGLIANSLESTTTLEMTETTTPVSADANHGFIYVKEDPSITGNTELFFFSDLNGTDTEVQLTSGGYLNAAATASFDFVAATGGVTAGDALYLASATEVGLADATTSGGADYVVGIAGATALAAAAVPVLATPGTIMTTGTITGFSAVGDLVFLSETAGALTTTAPTASGSTVYKVGYALTATTIVFQPQLISINP